MGAVAEPVSRLLSLGSRGGACWGRERASLASRQGRTDPEILDGGLEIGGSSSLGGRARTRVSIGGGAKGCSWVRKDWEGPGG